MQPWLSDLDLFLGNGTMAFPQPEGIAATWIFLKAQTGNTYPGACVPLGMFSVCAYSDAYPTGYGLNAPNTHATPPRRFEQLCASGFTHLQQSGTGAIETYYNCVRVTLQLGDKTFVVEAIGAADNAIYVQRVTLNGAPLDRAYITVDELLHGGVLRLMLGAQPATWARDSRPPSLSP